MSQGSLLVLVLLAIALLASLSYFFFRRRTVLADNRDPTEFIFRTHVNAFHYLYGDANYLYNLAKDPQRAQSFDRVPLCRSAALLFILSLEALINRAFDFLASEVRDFFLERESSFRTVDKFLMLPLLIEKRTFDEGAYPWSHFKELVQIRNDFVHPKHDRAAYYKARQDKSSQFAPLKFNEIPSSLGIKETDIVYRQLRVPKDPYDFLPEEVERIKKVVDDTIAELDRLLAGRVTKDNWAHRDQFELIYPPGAKLANGRSGGP